MTVRRHVIFQSMAFNTSEPKEYFINECCFGDDLAKWLMEELQARGIETGAEPGQEDFGWYFRYQLGEADYDLVIGYRPGEDGQAGDWICTIERGAGFLASIFGARKRDIPLEAAEAIHAVLSSAPQITGARWYTDDEMRTEEHGSDTPTGH
jgi:hypothetical protein